MLFAVIIANKAFLVSLILFVVAMAAATIYAALQDNQIKHHAIQDVEPNMAKRGAYVPWVIGAARVGGVFAWVQSGFRVDPHHGHSFPNGHYIKSKEYFQKAWHAIAVGPVSDLLCVYENDVPIVSGQFNSVNTPSGSTIYANNKSKFRIYWGEDTQPIDSDLASNLGVSSRWPGLCYVYWDDKRIAKIPRGADMSSVSWPTIHYDIVVNASSDLDSSIIANKVAEYEATSVSYDLIDTYAGASGTGYFEIGPFKDAGHIDADDKITISGTAHLDGAYTVKSTEIVKHYKTVPQYGVKFSHYTVKVYVSTSIGYSGETGTLAVANRVRSAIGANPAHVIYDLLFQEWPKGLGFDEDLWDIDSLKSLGEYCENAAGTDLELYTSWAARQGRTAKQLLSLGLNDLSCFCLMDTDTGKLKFTVLEEPESPLDNIDEDMIVDPLPEIVKHSSEQKKSRVVYLFKDMDNNWADTTISVDNDGVAALAQYQNTEEVQLSIAVNYTVAAILAEKKSQEVLSRFSNITLFCNRDCRSLIPGQCVTIDGYNEVMRVLEVELLPDSGKTKLVLMTDIFGIGAASFTHTKGDYKKPYNNSWSLDIAEALVELPELMSQKRNETWFGCSRIRRHALIAGATLYLSKDNTNYYTVSEDYFPATGGILTSALSSSQKGIVETGPTFTYVGIDSNIVKDLSSDTENWRRGDQLLFMNGEIMFVREVVHVSGDTYRLDGIIRARYDTPIQNHVVDDMFILCDKSEFDVFTTDLFVPGDTWYFKAVPYGGSISEQSLDDIPALSGDLEGKGIKPMAPLNLKAVDPRPCVPGWEAGEDLKFRWSYRSALTPRTGAGMQGAGERTSVSEVDGECILQVLDSSNNVKREVNLEQATEYSYSNSTLKSDFGGSEPTSFKIRVYITRGGYTSDAAELSMTRL